MIEDVPLEKYMYLVFTLIAGESYRRRIRSLLYLCYIFRALISSLVRWVGGGGGAKKEWGGGEGGKEGESSEKEEGGEAGQVVSVCCPTREHQFVSKTQGATVPSACYQVWLAESKPSESSRRKLKG